MLGYNYIVHCIRIVSRVCTPMCTNVLVFMQSEVFVTLHHLRDDSTTLTLESFGQYLSCNAGLRFGMTDKATDGRTH